jgi:hypothetical protein
MPMNSLFHGGLSGVVLKTSNRANEPSPTCMVQQESAATGPTYI